MTYVIKSYYLEYIKMIKKLFFRNTLHCFEDFNEKIDY